jgi:hypothetical protein
MVQPAASHTQRAGGAQSASTKQEFMPVHLLPPQLCVHMVQPGAPYPMHSDPAMQSLLCAQVAEQPPHSPGIPPPPQVLQEGQSPQVRTPPQPSPAMPQAMPIWAQVLGQQPA